jgi:hypothetical protein
MASTLTEEEIIDASGGYVRPAEQIRELHRRGFWRAFRSTLNGRVVLERPHFDEVSRGGTSAPVEKQGPKLRKPSKSNAVTA